MFFTAFVDIGPYSYKIGIGHLAKLNKSTIHVCQLGGIYAHLHPESYCFWHAHIHGKHQASSVGLSGGTRGKVNPSHGKLCYGHPHLTIGNKALEHQPLQ